MISGYRWIFMPKPSAEGGKNYRRIRSDAFIWSFICASQHSRTSFLCWFLDCSKDKVRPYIAAYKIIWPSCEIFESGSYRFMDFIADGYIHSLRYINQNKIKNIKERLKDGLARYNNKKHKTTDAIDLTPKILELEKEIFSKNVTFLWWAFLLFILSSYFSLYWLPS